VLCLQLHKVRFAEVILFCVCSCTKCADSRNRGQHSPGHLHGNVLPIQLYPDVPGSSSDTVLWPECNRPGCGVGVILHRDEPDCHWCWCLRLCQGTDLMLFAHAFKGICLQGHLPTWWIKLRFTALDECRSCGNGFMPFCEQLSQGTFKPS